MDYSCKCGEIITRPQTSDIAPVGKILRRRGKSGMSHCPLCQGEEETNVHLWTCSNDKLQDIFSKGMEHIKQQLQQGPECYKNFLFGQIALLRMGEEENTTETDWMEPYKQIFIQQKQLGTWASLWGFYHRGIW